MRAREDLPALLDAVARTIGESLGYRTVAVNLYRPAWDDFKVTTVLRERGGAGDPARQGAARRGMDGAPRRALRAARRLRRAGRVGRLGRARAELRAAGSPGVHPDDWHPEDALFLPMRHTDGHLLGIVSVDEPVSGRRPTDEELEVLVVARRPRGARRRGRARGGRGARGTGSRSSSCSPCRRASPARPRRDEILRQVCTGIRDALGFQQRLRARSSTPTTGRARAARGGRLATRGDAPSASP